MLPLCGVTTPGGGGGQYIGGGDFKGQVVARPLPKEGLTGWMGLELGPTFLSSLGAHTKEHAHVPQTSDMQHLIFLNIILHLNLPPFYFPLQIP